MAFWLITAWMAQAVAATLLCAWYLRLLDRPQPRPGATPPVLVLAPVRGPVDPGFLPGLAAQDYPAWRVAFAVEWRDDPAFPALAGFVAAHPDRACLVVAGPAGRRGQKVQNLLAALATLRPEEAAVVTVDADIHPPPDFLSRLLRPVLAGQGDIASGYRWTLAVDARWGSRLVALADMAVATLPRCAGCNLCWGGATALSRAALERLDLPRVWGGAVSDDLALTRSARAAGLRIYAPLDVRPATPVSFDLAGALRFGIRQHRLLHLLAPRAWALAVAALALPVAGLGAALVAGPVTLAGCAAASLALGLLRARLRARIARRILPPGDAATASRALRRSPLAMPAALALHLVAAIGGALGRTLVWAGRRYALDARGDVRAITPAPAAPPAAAPAPRRR